MRNHPAIRTYSDLIRRRTFLERFEYCRQHAQVGYQTFGPFRIFNQEFYTSYRWKKARRGVIIRDKGCDLGLEGYDIFGPVHVHHLNVVTLEDLEMDRPWLYDEEYLISTSERTHKAITLGDRSLLADEPVERTLYDMAPWRQ